MYRVTSILSTIFILPITLIITSSNSFSYDTTNLTHDQIQAIKERLQSQKTKYEDKVPINDTVKYNRKDKGTYVGAVTGGDDDYDSESYFKEVDDHDDEYDAENYFKVVEDSRDLLGEKNENDEKTAGNILDSGLLNNIKSISSEVYTVAKKVVTFENLLKVSLLAGAAHTGYIPLMGLANVLADRIGNKKEQTWISTIGSMTAGMVSGTAAGCVSAAHILSHNFVVQHVCAEATRSSIHEIYHCTTEKKEFTKKDFFLKVAAGAVGIGSIGILEGPCGEIVDKVMKNSINTVTSTVIEQFGKEDSLDLKHLSQRGLASLIATVLTSPLELLVEKGTPCLNEDPFLDDDSFHLKSDEDDEIKGKDKKEDTQLEKTAMKLTKFLNYQQQMTQKKVMNLLKVKSMKEVTPEMRDRVSYHLLIEEEKQRIYKELMYFKSFQKFGDKIEEIYNNMLTGPIHDEAIKGLAEKMQHEPKL